MPLSHNTMYGSIVMTLDKDEEVQDPSASNEFHTPVSGDRCKM